MTNIGESAMAAPIFEYNNPAGRLYQHFKVLVAIPGSALPMSKFSELLGIAGSWEAVIAAIADMMQDYEELERIIEGHKDNEDQYKLWNTNLGDVKKSVSGFALNMGGNTCQMNIVPSAVVALQFMAASIPKEQAVVKDELEALRKQCDDLRQEIYACEDLPKPLRAWLLDLVRLMRDSIDRYKIRGSRGLSRQLHEMLGSMMTNYEYVLKTQAAAPPIWARVMTGFETMVKLSKYVETAEKSLSYVAKAIAYFHGDSTPTHTLE
jgi:hypothetical protein